jgi:hypothetical protein
MNERLSSAAGCSRLLVRAAGTYKDGLLHVHERHEHHHQARVDTASYELTMRPWTSSELHARLGRAGLTIIDLRAGIGRRASDRLTCVAAPSHTRG